MPIVAEERGKALPTVQFEALRGQLRTIDDLALIILHPLQCFVHADVNADPQAAAMVMSLLNMLAAETGRHGAGDAPCEKRTTGTQEQR